MNSRGGTSIKDLTERLGISKTSLYIYLKDPGTTRLGAETKRRIDEAFGDLEFHPNVNAQSLSEGRSNVVAILIPLDAPYFRNTMLSELLSGIQTVLFSRSYKMVFIPPKIVHSVSRSTGILRDQMKAAAGYDACILFGTRACSGADMRENVEYMMASRMPFVVVNMPPVDYTVNQVVNVTPRASSGTRLLFSMGHRKILFMGGTETAPDTEIAFKEYHSLHEEYGIPVDAGLVRNGGYERAAARSETLRAIDEGRRFSAIFCLSDMMALGVYEAAADRGLSIPGDISVIGKDDALFATAMRPRLTTVKVPAYETGKRAAELALETIRGSSPPRRIELDNELLMRESVGPFPAVQYEASQREGGAETSS